MKKVFVLCCVLTLSLALLQVPAQAQSRFGFKVSGGLAYAGGGDINNGLQGWSDFYHEFMSLLGYSPVSGGYDPFHLGLDFQGEFLFQVSPSVALGLGGGYMTISKDSTLTGTYLSNSVSLTWKPQVTAIPITFNFHYYVPAGSSLKFVFTAGVGYYLTKPNFDFVIGGSGSSSTEKYDLSGSGFGFHGGLGLDVALSPAVSLVLDFLGRYATASGFTGSYTTSSGSQTNGKLYYYEATVTGAGVFPVLTYSNTMPSGSGVGNAREAKLDLSGFSALLGFVFHF